MSKSIDYHEGCIQTLKDIQPFLLPYHKVTDAIEMHEKEIIKIMDEMNEAYNPK